MADEHVNSRVEDTLQSTLHRRARILTTVSVLLAVAGLVAVSWITTVHPRTDDAEIFANFIGIAPVVAGPIQELHVADNQRVQQGDLLGYIRISPKAKLMKRQISSVWGGIFRVYGDDRKCDQEY
jgi:multidrug resistance efflux pump